MKKIISAFLVCVLAMTTGCATNSQTRWALISTAAPIGATVGYSTAPDDEKPESHALLWSAVFVSVAALIGNYFYSDSKELEQLRSENDSLKNVPKFEVISEKEAYFTEPGSNGEKKKYKVSQKRIDVWLDDGPNKKYHQDIMIERIKVPENEEKKTNGK